MNNLILLNKINLYFDSFIDYPSGEASSVKLFGRFSEINLMFQNHNKRNSFLQMYSQRYDEQYYDILSFDITLLKNYNNFLEQSIFVIEILIKEFDILNQKYSKILFHDGFLGVFYNLEKDESYYGDKKFGPNSYFNLEVERVDIISDLAKEQKF